MSAARPARPARRGGALALVLALAFTHGAPARADGETPATLLHRGMAERRAGNYDKAVADFRRAFERTGEPNYLFLLAETQREAGLVKDALASYRRYLELSPGAPDASVAREHIEELEQQPQIPPGQAVPALRGAPGPANPAGPAGSAPAAPRPAPRAVVEELPAAPPQVVVSKGPLGPVEGVPLCRRPWLWVAVGAVAAGGLALGIGFGLRPSAPSFFVAPGATP